MKLPDYQKCVELKKLMVEMGVQRIPILKQATFVREVTKTQIIEVPNPTVSFSNKLETSSVRLTNESITIASDETIEINGLKACAYIKEQRNGAVDHSRNISKYRYHLCNCNTIQQMISNGRKDRYVSTTRCDGLFPVVDQSSYSAQTAIVKMELCQNCKKILENNKMLPTPYSLRAFFDKYQPEIPKNIRKTEQVIAQEQYAPNQADIAKKYKESVQYICQFCGVDCKTEKQCLHLHHRDGNGRNNAPYNLAVLCTDCHSKEPNHTQMLSNPGYRAQCRIISNLRNQQQIISLK